MNPQKFAEQTIFLCSPILLAMMFALFLFTPVSAKNLNEYRQSIRTAQKYTEELLQYVEATAAGDEDYEYESGIIKEIRSNLPASEIIEWQGSSVETANQWLRDKLDNFQKEKNTAKRAESLMAVNERLAALREKLDELENSSISNRAKDEDKRKLAEILRRADYQKPEQPKESLLQKWYRQLMEWLANVFPRPAMPDAAPSGFQSFSYILQILLYSLVFGAIGFLLYKFAPLFIRQYRVKEKREVNERVILGDRIAANESAENLFGEAEALAREGNWRGAIRKGYTAVLCDLSDKKVIGLARHKTNRDYLRDVRRRRELYENMNGLTNSFERHCYGLETAVEEDWNEFQQGYRQAVSHKP